MVVESKRTATTTETVQIVTNVPCNVTINETQVEGTCNGTETAQQEVTNVELIRTQMTVVQAIHGVCQGTIVSKGPSAATYDSTDASGVHQFNDEGNGDGDDDDLL